MCLLMVPLISNSSTNSDDDKMYCKLDLKKITIKITLFHFQFKSSESPSTQPPGELLLTSSNIRSLQDLHQFFVSLSHRREETTNQSESHLNVGQLEAVIEQDFLEKMPSVPTR